MSRLPEGNEGEGVFAEMNHLCSRKAIYAQLTACISEASLADVQDCQYLYKVARPLPFIMSECQISNQECIMEQQHNKGNFHVVSKGVRVLLSQLGVLCECSHGFFSPLSNTLLAEGVPCTLPLHNSHTLRSIKQAAKGGYAAAKHDVKLCCLEGRCTFVLHHLHGTQSTLMEMWLDITTAK